MMSVSLCKTFGVSLFGNLMVRVSLCANLLVSVCLETLW